MFNYTFPCLSRFGHRSPSHWPLEWRLLFSREAKALDQREKYLGIGR